MKCLLLPLLLCSISTLYPMKRDLQVEPESAHKKHHTEAMVTKLADDVMDMDLVDAFFQAVQKGDKQEVLKLLDAGVPVNSTDGTDSTALLTATCNNDNEMVDLLLAKGADVNVQNILEQTPLLLAAHNKSYDIAQELLLKGASVTPEFLHIKEAGDEDITFAVELLTYSAKCGFVTVVKRLLQAGVLVDALNKDGFTALNQAVEGAGAYERLLNKQRSFRAQTIQTLLDAGANINFCPDTLEPYTILALAALSNDLATMKLLLARHDIDINADDGEALNTAVERGYKEAVKLLLDAGADPNRHNYKRSVYAPLLVALSKKHAEIALMLIQRGAEVQQYTDAHGRTALELALLYKLTPVIQALLEKGARLEDGDETVNEFIRVALLGDKARLEYMLNDNGMLLNRYYELGNISALVGACIMGHTSIVTFLLDRGASIPNKELLLTIALKKGYKALIEELLNRGADSNHVTITSAVKAGQREVIDTYLDKLTAKSIPGKAVYRALEKKYFDLITKFLEKYNSCQPSSTVNYCQESHIINYLLQCEGLLPKQGILRCFTRLDEHMAFLLASLAQPEVQEYIQARMTSLKNYIEYCIRYSTLSIKSQTFMTWACILNHKDVIAVVVGEYSKYVHRLCNVQDVQGRTALFYAVMANHQEVVSMLLDGNNNAEIGTPNPYGIDVNKVDKQGNSILSYAVQQGNLKIVNSLLRAGAAITVKALHTAAQRGHKEIVVRLLAKLGESKKLQQGLGIPQKIEEHLQALFRD